jgi:hypothetical protein
VSTEANTGKFRYDEFLHSNSLHKNLDLSHLDPALQERIYRLVKKYLPVFDNRGVFAPVKNYECVIDTSNATHIAVKKSSMALKYFP